MLRGNKTYKGGITDSTNTPYDDVFRTLLNDCSYLILPVINEIFGEHYTGNKQIIFSQNEHFLNQQDGNEQERITDTSFRIIGDTEKKYYLKCQNSTDCRLLACFFEYDTPALKAKKYPAASYEVSDPHGSRQMYMQACPLGSLLRGNKVLEHIAKKYITLRKGVKDVMGGKILEYEAKTIRNAGIAVGKAAIKLGLDEETL